MSRGVYFCLFVCPLPYKQEDQRAGGDWLRVPAAGSTSQLRPPSEWQSSGGKVKNNETNKHQRRRNKHNARSVGRTTWPRFDTELTGTSGRPVSVCLRGDCMKQPGLRASWPLWPESWHIQPDCRSAAAGSWLREPAAAGRPRPGRKTSSVNWSAGTWTSTLCSRTWSASVRRTSTRFKTVKDELGLGNAQYFV